MKRTKVRRLLAWLLAVVMMMGSMPMSSFASVTNNAYRVATSSNADFNVQTGSNAGTLENEFVAEIATFANAAMAEVELGYTKEQAADDFGTNGYYKIISKKDYTLVPGAAIEYEMVLNNEAGTRRQVIHVIEVDPSNPDVSIVPGYNQIDKDLSDQANWSHKELTDMAKYYEDELGYNIVGGMNTDLYYDTYAPRILVYNGEDLSQKGKTTPSSSILYVFQDEDGNISCDVKAFNREDFNKYLEDGTLLHAVSVSFGMVVKDGKLVSTKEERTSDPAARSMVGVKPNGALVICMNDGRGANNSVGFCNYEEGEAMLELGCLWAANCDGGGSSTFLTKRVGEETFTMRSVPCDGAQRPTAHGVFVTSNVAPTGELDVINVNSEYDIFAPNTEYEFGAEAIDTHGYAMDIPADAKWTLSNDEFGSIEDGVFTSNGETGDVDIQIEAGGKVVGSKTITIADPEVFKLSATSTVVPYSTPDKIRTITLPIVAMTGEANVYVDTNAVSVALSNENAGELDGFNFTATDDTSIAGVDVTVVYNNIKLVYAIEFGKGSEVIFDFEDGDKAGFMGFEEAKKWSQDNGVNNTLVGSDPLAGQFNEYLSSETFVASTTDGGQVRNGDYALAWRLDNTDAAFASWSYNVLFNTNETIVLRDVANGMKATTLGMWLYVPENAFPAAGKGLAFQSQLYVKNADGTYSCKQDHFMFKSAATGAMTNLNSATNADIPESRWVYATIDISKYDYLCTPVASDTGNSRSPSFLRTYVKPDTADEVTFYIDDITLDYSSAVDDRVLPTITAPTYSTSDTAVTLNNGTEVAGNKVAFSATVTDNAALDLTSGKIYVDGIELNAAISGNTLSSKEDANLFAGSHTVTFEVKDELGNPAKLTRTFTVAGNAVVSLTGHNDSGNAPKAQSIYYVDVNVDDITNVETLTANLKLHNANKWETEGAEVANGFTASYEYNEVSELLTVTVEVEDVAKIDADASTLVSIPVRVWTFDRYNYVTNTYYAVEDLGNKPVVNIECDVAYGKIELADDTTSPFGGSINVATELTTISSPYHVHDAELTVLNKAASIAAVGYENRTYCETCKSVVDWGTILDKLDHNYQIMDAQFVCIDEGCGHVYESGTGVFEMNGDHYYSIGGRLVTGWQDSENGGKCFAYSTYKLAIGEAVINGITYIFDENGNTNGAWVEDAKGTKYSYGPDFYSCKTAANPHANVAWAEIDGHKYAFDKNGYRHENISILIESNNPAKLYEFTSEGILIGEYKTDHTGIFVCNNATTYLSNGVPVAAGLVREGKDFYYINSGYVAVTGSYNVTRPNGLLPVGVYEFDENGKMLNVPELKNGPQDDGYFYIDGVKQLAYQLVEFEGDYYFINDYNKYAVNKTIYLTDKFLTNTEFQAGEFIFGADGKLVIKNGPDADGYFYLNGVKQLAYQLVEFEGDYYFINDYNKYAVNKTIYLTDKFLTNTEFQAGEFIFGADGKLVIKNGPDADGYFYLNGVKQLAYQLVEFEGDYYFISDYNKYAVNKQFYLKDEFLEGTSLKRWYYEFGPDGKMIGYTAGIANGRDLGEIPFLKTVDGYTIKEGMIFRGSELDGLETGISVEEAQVGIDFLKNDFNVKLDMDLRSTAYADMDIPDVLGQDVLHKYYGMVFYADAFSDEGKAVVKEIFTDLANPENYPIYMHCARGIDRVGTVSYILEAVLGISENVLAREYMLSVDAYGNDILKVRDGLKNYEGASIKECAESYLLDCGLTFEQIKTLRDILIDN